MKRVITLLLAFVLMISMCACGSKELSAEEATNEPEPTPQIPVESKNEPEPTPQIPVESKNDAFVLRNDIHFGETREIVLQKEGLPATDRGDGRMWTEPTKVSSFDGTKICFKFDDDSLEEMQYFFDAMTNSDIANSRYQTIYDGLVRKYGEPLSFPDGEHHRISTTALSDASLFWIIASMTKEPYGYTCDEWEIPIDDEISVKIELVNYYYGENHEMRLAYKRFTIDDIANEIYDELEQQTEVDNDL